MLALINFENVFIEAETRIYPEAETRGNSQRCGRSSFLCCAFTSHKWTAGYYVVHILDYFYIGVKVQSTIIIENPESCIIAHERIFSC